MKTAYRFLTSDTATPRGLFVWAVLLSAVFAGVHLAGWRELTTMLSATAVEGYTFAGTAARGAAYLLAYFGFVLGVPILLIAAGILKWMELPQGAAAKGTQSPR